MYSITLNDHDSATIAAMAKHIAPKVDVRYYLRGVWLECTADGWQAMATDGHMLTVARLQNPGVIYEGYAGPVFIPRELAVTMKGTAVLDAGDAGQPRQIRMGNGWHLIPADTREWTPPDWRKVAPHATSGEIAQFNPDLLASVQAVALAMRNASLRKSKARIVSQWLAHNGQNAALVTFELVDLIAVVMPMRADKIDRPAWSDAAPWQSAPASVAA